MLLGATWTACGDPGLGGESEKDFKDFGAAASGTTAVGAGIETGFDWGTLCGVTVSNSRHSRCLRVRWFLPPRRSQQPALGVFEVYLC